MTLTLTLFVFKTQERVCIVDGDGVSGAFATRSYKMALVDHWTDLPEIRHWEVAACI
jgi:hypothetical protein